MTKQDVDKIIDLMNTNDNHCSGAPQQVANGFYRLFDLLVLFANSLDADLKHSADIAAIKANLTINNSYCKGASQQSANGSYRIVELMKHIIAMKDPEGLKTSTVDGIIGTMNANNSYCQGAPQQMANGSYRLTEMLQVFIQLVKPELNPQVDELMKARDRMNSLCSGAPQQTANGTDTLANMVKLLVGAYDTENKYEGKIVGIVGHMERNNSMCKGADQQSANYLYRTMDFLQILAEIYLDAIRKRTAEYWAEHPDEMAALLKEKTAKKTEVEAIEEEASKVTDEGKAAAVQAEVMELEGRRDTCNKEELEEFKGRLSKLNTELDGLGLFKGSEKKALRARIAEVEAAEKELQSKTDTQIATLQKQIDEKKAEIVAIGKDLEARKQAVLDKATPIKERLSEIERELTKPR